MSAINAKSYKERATIAISMIKAHCTQRRSFYNCFEMGDGDEVIKEILNRSTSDPAIERYYPHIAEWRKAFNHV